MAADSVTAEALAKVIRRATFNKRIPAKVVEHYAVAGIVNLYTQELIGNAAI